MSFDFGKIFRFALIDWVKDKSSLKIFGVLAVWYFIVNVIVSYLFGSFFSLVPSGENANIPPELFGAFFGMIGAFIAIVFVSILVLMLVQYFVYSRALKLSGRKFVQFTFERYLRMIVLCLTSGFVALVSLFDLKMLWIAIVAIVLLGIALVLLIFNSGNSILVLLGILFILISVLLFLAYYIVIVYNSLRLVLGPAFFIEKEKTLMDALKASWDTTKGNVFNIFVALIAVGIIVSALSYVLSLPLNAYFGLLGDLSSQTSLSSLGQMMMSPEVIVLSVFSVLASAYAAMAGAFVIVGVFNELQKKK